MRPISTNGVPVTVGLRCIVSVGGGFIGLQLTEAEVIRINKLSVTVKLYPGPHQPGWAGGCIHQGQTRRITYDKLDSNGLFYALWAL